MLTAPRFFGQPQVEEGSKPLHYVPRNTSCGDVVRVDDVDAHYEQARAAGAEIEYEPMDQPYGVREYGAIDPEGHRWAFVTPLG